jgi:hypothetical protein
MAGSGAVGLPARRTLFHTGLYGCGFVASTLAVLLISSHTFKSEQQATVADGTDLRDDLTLASCYKADESLARIGTESADGKKLGTAYGKLYGSTSV